MKLYSDEELAEILDQNIFHQISEAADRLGLECYVTSTESKQQKSLENVTISQTKIH